MLYRLFHRRGPGERGSSVVEMAIMAPVLAAMVLWLIYFWEMQQARLKAAEAARYLAFNQAVGAGRNDVIARFEDLDSSSPTGKLPLAYFNKVTVRQATTTLVNSPLADPASSARPPGVGGWASWIFGVLSRGMGSASDSVMRYFGLNPSNGRVQANTEIFMKNMLIPKRIGDYMSGEDGGSIKLDLSFKDSMTMDFQTFAAVDANAWSRMPLNNAGYDRVSDLTTNTVRRMAFLGVYDRFSTWLDIIEAAFGLLGVEDFPFSGNYIRDTTRIYSPTTQFRYGVSVSGDGRQASYPVRTAPGDTYHALYYTGSGDSFCYSPQWWRACEPRQIRDLRQRNNPDYRAYNCRGDYYQGTTRSQFSELDYGGNARSIYNFNSSSGCQ